jgi:hypothetical protein
MCWLSTQIIDEFSVEVRLRSGNRVSRDGQAKRVNAQVGASQVWQTTQSMGLSGD